MHLARALRLYSQTLERLRDHSEPRQTGFRQRPDGAVVVATFPANLQDRIVLAGVRGEAWLSPYVTPAMSSVAGTIAAAPKAG